MYFNFLTWAFFGLIWLSLIAILRLKKRTSFIYLIFFSIFFIYIFKVLDYTLFQFQSLLILKYFIPKLILHGVTDGKSINLIPLLTLTQEDLQTSLLNILMMIPFGFGLPFITNFRLKQTLVLGLFFSILIEFMQFITGSIAQMTFRIADVNDVIFNTLGVAIGIGLFTKFVHSTHYLMPKKKGLIGPVLDFITKRHQRK